jgi:hypothetical protein
VRRSTPDDASTTLLPTPVRDSPISCGVWCVREKGCADAESALGWPARAGKLVLTIALDRIADYYRVR